MPERSLMLKLAQPTPLRRSPRFLHLQNTPPKPTTPNPILRVHPISNISPLTPSEPNSRSRYKRLVNFPKKCDNGPQGCKKSSTGSRKASRFRGKSKLNLSDSSICISPKKGLEKSDAGGSGNCGGKSANGSRRASTLNSRFEGLRRSPRFRNEVNSLVVVDMTCKGNSDRRITRSAAKRMGVGTDLWEQSAERRSTRALCRNVAGKSESKNPKKQKQEASDEARKRVSRSSVAPLSIRIEEEVGIKDIDEKKKECNDVCKDSRLIGIKRARKQARVQGTDQGWTMEQQAALQRAYFAAKPSPHFWKNVAKLVPGKSAQECFDKVHSDNQTPLSTRPSSRAKRWKSPSNSPLSGSKLFQSAEKAKKRGRSKWKSNAARKTARHLLQKHCHVNQDTAADLFSLLEPTVNPSAEAFQLNAVQSTPQHLLGSPGSSSKCRERSSSNHKSRVSRLSGARDSLLTSPPVLKKVKNIALHEKYLDQLHTREAKRKWASKRCLNSVLCQNDGEENPAVMKDVIKAAKEALISDAKDVMSQFRHSQANIMGGFSDSEEGLNSDDEEDGIVV